MERELRDLKARVEDIAQRLHGVSEERLNKLWASVRETMNEFTGKLAEQELARRGMSDTIASVILKQNQMEVIMQAHAVQLNDMQNQLNTAVVQLNSMLSGAR